MGTNPPPGPEGIQWPVLMRPLEEPWIAMDQGAGGGAPDTGAPPDAGEKSSRCSRHCPEPAAGPDEPIVG